MVKFTAIVFAVIFCSFGFLKGSEVVVDHLVAKRAIASKYTPNQSDEFSVKQKVTE